MYSFPFSEYYHQTTVPKNICHDQLEMKALSQNCFLFSATNREPLCPTTIWEGSCLSAKMSKMSMKYCLYFLKEEKTTGCVRCIFCRKSDKCRDINIHKMGNWTIRFLGRFTFSWRGMISRLWLQNIWLRWEKYYQVDCSLLIIHWFIIFWDTIWSKQVTNSQRFSNKYTNHFTLFISRLNFWSKSIKIESQFAQNWLKREI